MGPSTTRPSPVRRQIGNIYAAFVSLQSARLSRRAAENAVQRHQVQLAESERTLDQIEKSMLPLAQTTLQRCVEQFSQAEISLEDYQSHLGEAAEIAQSHRDALIRHRKAMLDLNTSVGLRLLPYLESSHRCPSLTTALPSLRRSLRSVTFITIQAR